MYFMHRRRRGTRTPQRAVAAELPSVNREDARQKLREVTEISHLEEEKHACISTEEESRIDTKSMTEKEWYVLTLFYL